MVTRGNVADPRSGEDQPSRGERRAHCSLVHISDQGYSPQAASKKHEGKVLHIAPYGPQSSQAGTARSIWKGERAE
jgi:hypothetical protein